MKKLNYEYQEAAVDTVLAEAARDKNESVLALSAGEENERLLLYSTQEEVGKLRREMLRLKQEQEVLDKRHQEQGHKTAVHVVPVGDFAMPTITLGEFLATLVDAKSLIAKVVLFFAVLGLAYLFMTEPTYEADASLETGVSMAVLPDISVPKDIKNLTGVNEQIEILKSRKLLGKVVDDLQLDIVAMPVYMPVIGAAIARINTKIKTRIDPTFEPDLPLINFNGYAWSNERINIKTFEVPSHYLGKLFTLVVKDDRRYRLSDEEGNLLSEGTVGEANTRWLPDERPHTLLIERIQNATPGERFELSRIPRIDAINQLRDALTVVEQGMGSGVIQVSLEGADKNKITAIVNKIVSTFIAQAKEKKSDTIGLSLQFMESQLPALKAQGEKAEEALNSYRRKHSAFDLSRDNQITLERMVSIEAQLSELRRNRSEALSQFTPRSPKITALDAQMASLKNDLAALEQKVKTFPDTEREILNLSKDAELYSQLYTFLRNRVGQLKIVQDAPMDAVGVVDFAVPSKEPIKPQKAAILVVAVVLGVFFGIGAAFLRKTLKGAVQDPSAIEKELGLHVYATIPHSLEQHKLLKNPEETKKAVLAIAESTDPAIESVRSLRTSLHFALLESTNNVILITGPTPGIGKSFLTVNLGAVLASAGKRVLIIDADLRKGRLNKNFGKDGKEGLSDYIASGDPIEKAIRKTYIDKVDIICTGLVPPNPSELLVHERFEQAVNKLSAVYDYVLIDSPPVLLVTDAVIIGQLAGATMLVVKAGVNTMREIELSAKRLEMGGVNLRGVVFNDMPLSNSRYGYGGYYGYAYTYAYKK
ncbi:MAG: polysaccharide biosynthesis tyrosine autokinase [Gammaproteobacteria bacterium]